MRAPVIELNLLNASIVAEPADGGGSLYEVTRCATRSSRNKLVLSEQGSHIDGLEVSESTWGEWDRAYEECSAQALRDRLPNNALLPVPS